MDTNVKAVLFLSQVSTFLAQFHCLNFQYSRLYCLVMKLRILRHTKGFKISHDIVIVLREYCNLQYVAKGMVDRGEGGAIVNVSSQASQCALKEHSVYCKFIVHLLVYYVFQ